MMVFKSRESLCDSLDYILSMNELCDVVFLVGEEKIPVYGVKAILATRSRVLYQLILHNQRDVKVNKKKVKGEKLKGLFCTSVEFGMKDLRKACWDYFLRCLVN
ncbi:serine-enriched protein-like [Patella vulgata]|uniref:serine-enriched protein-like n=1 Tax=Patella vulgata TaxID=6465 RepID=UPI0024A97755|nr:serine-enriched protein-like [Patella vulgata]